MIWRKRRFDLWLMTLAAVSVCSCCVSSLLGQAQAPAAIITSIDSNTGLVDAKVNTTGQQFQFRLSNPARLRTLKIGQPIYANFANRRVSLDGKTLSGTIVNITTNPAAPTSAARNSSRSASNSNPQAPQNGKGLDIPTTTTRTVKAQFPGLAATRARLASMIPPLNPHHLPDLVPAIDIVLGPSCDIPPGSTCQQACPPTGPFQVPMGVLNRTPYPVNGTIYVYLQDLSGNNVRVWTVNGLQGNGYAHPGYFEMEIIPCLVVIGGGNYKLKVSAPGVTELDSTNNETGIYIPDGSPISP